MPNLIHDMLPCSQVNDDLLVKIASRRQNITEINISDCRGVHDHGVSSLASHCPSLQKYTAYRCKQLGDASLSALAAHCPLLVKVHVGNQDKLTDEALKKVPEMEFTLSIPEYSPIHVIYFHLLYVSSTFFFFWF